MNELIESILSNFTVDETAIPVKYMYYYGHGEPYIVYMQVDADGALFCDDELAGFVDYYDFDIYSKGNNTHIIERLKDILVSNGFVWQVSRTQREQFETDTGYYHKTLTFAYLKGGL